MWRDTADLWPGEDWRLKIRRAITDNALVFVACFSNRSIARKKSYQNEELLLAIEQLRLRRPDDPWLIPVRFDDCDIPDLEIGGGRSLPSIQRAGLFGDQRDAGIARLVSAILRILGRYSDSGMKGLPIGAQLNFSAAGESQDSDVAQFREPDQRSSEQKKRRVKLVDATTSFSTAGDPLQTVEGHNSKLLEIDLSSGRYLISWTTEGNGHFAIRDESEDDGEGRYLVTALVPDPSPEGQEIVRLGVSGRHLLSVTGKHLDWKFTFAPI